MYKCKFAGHYKGASAARLVPVKVKAHISEQAAKDLGCHLHWFGNDRADYWANDVRNTTGKAGVEYVAQQRAAFTDLLQATARICGLPRVDTYHSRDTRKRVAKEIAQKDPPRFRLSPRQLEMHSVRYEENQTHLHYSGRMLDLPSHHG
jgi:hypothetical protein